MYTAPSLSSRKRFIKKISLPILCFVLFFTANSMAAPKTSQTTKTFTKPKASTSKSTPLTTSSTSYPAEVFAALPEQYRETKIKLVQKSFEERALLFLQGRPFHSWSSNRSRDDILKEYEQINEWRFHSWYVDPKANILIARHDFMIAQELLEKNLFRKPNTIAFQYNVTDASYNSSTVVLNNMRFLALESPSTKTLQSFNTLLQNHQVKQLLRLSSAQDKGGSIPYWQGKQSKDPTSKELIYNISQPNSKTPYSIHYYAIEDWQEDKGYDPKALLNLIQRVRKNYDESQLVAVHCTNGVGRSGTFIAGMILLNEIDKQLAANANNPVNVSIEKIVMQLSLQRPFMVGNIEQYVTLYRLVDAYLLSLKK
jgi:hypothetical protein